MEQIETVKCAFCEIFRGPQQDSSLCQREKSLFPTFDSECSAQVCYIPILLVYYGLCSFFKDLGSTSVDFMSQIKPDLLD